MGKVIIGSLNVDQCGVGVLQVGNSEVQVTGEAKITNTNIAVLSMENGAELSKIIELTRIFPGVETETLEEFLSEFKTRSDVNEQSVLDKIKKYGLPIATDLTIIITSIIECLPS